MCTRFVLMEEHYRAVLDRLGIGAPARYASRFNIAPGTPVPAVRTSAEGPARAAVALQWGLIPAWAKSDRDKIVNARAESVATKPSFRDAFRSRRCIIPASGFFEWESVGRLKLPWLFRRSDEAPFGLAGLWEAWHGEEGPSIETCAVITTEPNELMRPIHNRMPAMLTMDQCEQWLDPSTTEAPLAALLQPAPAAAMTARRVSSRMNNARIDDPACVAPLAAAGDDPPPQLSFGF